MSERIERAVSKGILASELALTGAAVAGPAGAAVGGLAGLIVGDQDMVFPVDMIAIPAYQAYMLSGSPAMTVYIKAGETLMATGGNVDDVELGVREAATLEAPAKPKRRKKNPWIQFNKKFSYRAKRKSESSQEYLRKRTKAARIAYNKMKKGGK